MGRVKPFGICDLSGTKVRHDKMRKTWRNTMVRPELWEAKPKILDLQAPPPEKLFVENPRSEQSAVFANTTMEDVINQLSTIN